MITDPWFYTVAIPAVLIVGLSKGGFLGGVAVIGVPLLTLAISPVQAAAIMLPILIGMDVIGVWAYHRSFDKRSVAILLPAAAFGIAVGYLTAAYVSEAHVRLLIGIISLVFALDYWFRKTLPPAEHNRLKGSFWGALTGFTSFVSHAGSPPYQMYMLPLQLPPRLYAGTGAILFAGINLIKVPPYFLLGQFTNENMLTMLVLLPLAPLAMFVSIWLVHRVPQEPFYRIAYGCLVIVAVKLIWDGATILLGA
ncbi:MAG: sulfite exporter TauE/SafE family protein [Fimbriimonadaceae bacterium]|nr:sulfite exporter TauE/SafE family protein [Alphaproteobacteria bacterium]